MAILCIRILPNPNTTDPSLDVLRTQEGDVVWVAEDDHVFSFAELNCGQYRFIEVPGSQSDWIHLVESEVDVQEKTVRRRIRALDKSVLKGDIWKNKKTATKAEIDSITVTQIGVSNRR